MIPLRDFAGRAADHHHTTGRPYVTLTYAQGIDGSLAVRRDQRLVLSGEESRLMTHRLRAVHDAILVGIGTVLADDPRLTAHLVGGPDPQPVIVDSFLRLPLTARLLHGPGLKPWIFAADTPDAGREDELKRVGARIYPISSQAGGWLDLNALLTVLGSLGVKSLMVEGGARIITSFLTGYLANWLVITIAPVFVGGIRAVEPAGDGVSRPFPAVRDVHGEQFGRDFVIWGELEGQN